MKIPLQTGKPTETGLYVAMTTWEAAPEIKAFLTLLWNGSHFTYPFFKEKTLFTRPVLGWVGPIATELEMEYDL